MALKMSQAVIRSEPGKSRRETDLFRNNFLKASGHSKAEYSSQLQFPCPLCQGMGRAGSKNRKRAGKRGVGANSPMQNVRPAGKASSRSEPCKRSPGEGVLPSAASWGPRFPPVAPLSTLGLQGVNAQSRRLILALAGLKHKLGSRRLPSWDTAGWTLLRPGGPPLPIGTLDGFSSNPSRVSGTPGDQRLSEWREPGSRPGPLPPVSRLSVRVQQPGRGAGRAGEAEAARYSCRCELPACYEQHPITPPTGRADPHPPSLIP